ncbi:MAG: glycosyl hydrolase [Acidobacteria bacterium]|nr:glycosyl hydrolase [Acidobacteriota bacterium]
MRRFMLTVVSCTLIAGLAGPVAARKATPKVKKAAAVRSEAKLSATLAGLKFRSIGPALTSGRITDIAVNPEHPEIFYVASASGGVWKTVNGGTTFEPIFDHEGSYSIGCVTVDHTNPSVVWVGTGENNSQRSVSFGDGVYRSDDGGAHWKNMGLKTSEHISKIVIDPRDDRVVWVAAQGPLWRDGGDRGLYKTTDGGRTWKAVLSISPRTGVTDVVLDPRNPDVVYAAAYERQRHVWTLVDGGPESAIYKSTNGGATWRKLTNGLPKNVDLGRIGLAIAPSAPDTVYAIVEAAEGKGGFYRSTDRGETWERRSDYTTSSPQYYNEIFCDPNDPNRVYAMDTFMHVTEDGGKTWSKVPENHKHVDNHALWIDPKDTRHLLAGCDGGLYESWDRGATWRFFSNLPVTQFYRVALDTSEPFYFVYGGTQDNATLGGPSATLNGTGITDADWFVTVFGDGFRPAVDPKNPDTVYSESQYGGLVRYDRKTGEMVDIQPQPAPGQPPLRWNWDTPLIISPHDHNRLYVAAQEIYRSDDRGNSWRAISPDLTRGLDRNALPVLGRVWSVDAVAKNASTSPYGNIVALTESPLVAGLLYAGTDDGLIQVTEDGGAHWRKIDHVPGVPERTYVSALVASASDPNLVYAAFDNHKMGDFKPYLYRSTDRGRTWTPIMSNLPDRQIVHAVAEDPGDPSLLFAGTEFGVWFSPDAGGRWIQLKGGLPTIAVRDLAIQREKHDLVLATFGRGFYVLDDYRPLREVGRGVLKKPAALFDVRDALLYVPRQPLGIHGTGFLGDNFYAASNPPFGAVVTYFLKNGLESRAEARRAAERKARKAGKTIAWPSWNELRAEDREVAPAVVLTIKDDAGNVVRRITGPTKAGIHRVAWDLRYPATTPVPLKKKTDLAPWDEPDRGPLVLPGTYSVTLETLIDGVLKDVAGPVSFRVRPLAGHVPPASVLRATAAFREQVARLRGAAHGALEAANEASVQLERIRKTLLVAPGTDPVLIQKVTVLTDRLDDILTALRGDTTKTKRWTPAPPSVIDRVERIVGSQWLTNEPPTRTQKDAFRWASQALAAQLTKLRTLVTVDIAAINQKLAAAGAPWTPCRIPEWKTGEGRQGK